MEAFEYNNATFFADVNKRVVKRVDRWSVKVYGDGFFLKSKKYDRVADLVFEDPDAFKRLFGEKYGMFVTARDGSIKIEYWTEVEECDDVIKNVSGYDFIKTDCGGWFRPDYVKPVGDYVVVYRMKGVMYVVKKGLPTVIYVVNAGLEKVMDKEYMGRIIEGLEALLSKPYVGTISGSDGFEDSPDFIVRLQVKGKWKELGALRIKGERAMIDLATSEGLVTHVASIDRLDKIIEDPDEKIYAVKFPYPLRNVVAIRVEDSTNGGELITFKLSGCRDISFNTLSKKFRVSVDGRNYYYRFEKMKTALKKAGCEVVER